MLLLVLQATATKEQRDSAIAETWEPSALGTCL